MELAVDKSTEDVIAKSAEALNVSVAEFMVGAALEKLEEIENARVVENHKRRKARGEVETISNRELAKKYGIEL